MKSISWKTSQLAVCDYYAESMNCAYVKLKCWACQFSFSHYLASERAIEQWIRRIYLILCFDIYLAYTIRVLQQLCSFRYNLAKVEWHKFRCVQLEPQTPKKVLRSNLRCLNLLERKFCFLFHYSRWLRANSFELGIFNFIHREWSILHRKCFGGLKFAQ